MAEQFPNVNQIVGADNVVKILNPKYYGDGTPEAMFEVLNRIQKAGCKFLVGGRLD